jgi:hypothetical protein
VREEVDTSEFCKPPSGGGGGTEEEGFGCPIYYGETFCPMDCDFCFHLGVKPKDPKKQK